MNWLSIVSIFAKPLGAIINKGLAAGSAAFIGWTVAKGLPMESASGIASAVVLGISTIISGFAASQGVQIPIINADQTNGVVVVSAQAATHAGVKPVSP